MNTKIAVPVTKIPRVSSDAILYWLSEPITWMNNNKDG